MTTRSWKLGAAFGAMLYAFAVPAFGQDSTTTKQPKTVQPKSERDQAVETMPTWEAYDTNFDENLEETFFRLSRDFVSTSELGVRRLGSVPIWPRGDLKIGPVRILPYIREAIEYESNFFLQPDTGPTQHEHGRETGWTHVNQAGFFADTALAGGRARISASVDSIWNVRYKDDHPDEWELDSQLGGTYRWNCGLWITAGVALERRDDPADFEVTGQKFQRTNRRFFVNWGMDRDFIFGSKVQFEMGVAVRNVEADEVEFSDIDRTESTYFAKASYPFWKKTTRIFVLGTLREDVRNSDRINDGYVGGTAIGMEGSIPMGEGEYRGLRGQVSVGFQSAVYEDDTYFRGSEEFIADDNRRNSNVSVQAALQYVMSTRTSADLRYLRSNQFSTRGNYQIVDRVDLTFSHNFTRQLVGRLAMYAEHAAPSGMLNPDTVDGPTPQSEDAPSVNYTGIGVGVRYAFTDWMDFDASFDIENRNAEKATSWKNYRGILGVTFYLNALTPRSRSASER